MPVILCTFLCRNLQHQKTLEVCLRYFSTHLQEQHHSMQVINSSHHHSDSTVRCDATGCLHCFVAYMLLVHCPPAPPPSSTLTTVHSEQDRRTDNVLCIILWVQLLAKEEREKESDVWWPECVECFYTEFLKHFACWKLDRTEQNLP